VKITDRSSTLFSSPSSSSFSSYFASYNVPSDREIYDYLGFGLKVKLNGREKEKGRGGRQGRGGGMLEG